MGELYALLCAVFWAFAVILLRRSGERVGPYPLNLFRVACSLPFLLVTLLVVGDPLSHRLPHREALLLVGSGVLGIAVADTLFHRSLNLIGAGITGIIDTFYSPSTVVLAFLLLGERISRSDFGGMLLIMAAVLLSSTLRPPEGRSRAELVRGIVIGLTGISFLALAVVMIKPVVDQFPVLWVTAVRQASALVVLTGAGLVSPRRKEIFAVFRPSAAWRTTVPATFLGSYLALIFWLAGIKHAQASVAAILTQSSTVFILILSVVFLREPMSRRRALSAFLALAGVLLVMR